MFRSAASLLIVRQILCSQPSSPLAAEQVRKWALRNQICVQDRLHDRFQSNPLPNQLGAARDLPPARVRGIGDPDLGQEACGVELRQYACVDRVSLDLRFRRSECAWQRIHHGHSRHMRNKNLRNCCRIAGRLHNDVIRREPSVLAKALKMIPRHANPAETLDLSHPRRPPLRRRRGGYPYR